MDYRRTLDSVSDSVDGAGQFLLAAAGALGDFLIEAFAPLFRALVASPSGVLLFVAFYLAYRFFSAGLGPAFRRERDRRYGMPVGRQGLMRYTVPGGMVFLGGFGLFWWTQPAYFRSLTSLPVVAAGFGLVILGCYLYRAPEAGAAEAPPPGRMPGPSERPEVRKYIDPLEGVAATPVLRVPRSGGLLPAVRFGLPLGLVAVGLLMVGAALSTFGAAVGERRTAERIERQEAVRRLDLGLGEAVAAVGDVLLEEPSGDGVPTEQAQLPVP
jgi:hypothetical protein